MCACVRVGQADMPENSADSIAKQKRMMDMAAATTSRDALAWTDETYGFHPGAGTDMAERMATLFGAGKQKQTHKSKPSGSGVSSSGGSSATTAAPPAAALGPGRTGDPDTDSAERPTYHVLAVNTMLDFEIRKYPPLIVAETASAPRPNRVQPTQKLGERGGRGSGRGDGGGGDGAFMTLASFIGVLGAFDCHSASSALYLYLYLYLNFLSLCVHLHVRVRFHIYNP